MRRQAARQPAQIDYTKVSDTALKDIRQHVGAESRQYGQLEGDRRLWLGKLAAVEKEMKRRCLI